MDILKRNNVHVKGSGDRAIVFAHGFGCDQTMWRFVAPNFESDYKIVLYDLTGAGRSDRAAYDFTEYATLKRHGQDIVDICDALDQERPIVVGHSVSATTAALAAADNPGRFDRIVMVSPSPSFLNDGDYHGGFDPADLEPIVDAMDENWQGWSQQFAPVIVGRDPSAPASQELTQSFCQTDPAIARHFGRVTFMSDHRDDMQRVETPALVIQCSDDAIAPRSVGEWLDREMPNSTLRVINAVGHCPHMTDPEIVDQAMRDYLNDAA